MTHTHKRIYSMTALDEESACRRDLYLITYNTHKRKTSTLAEGFEPTTPASDQPQTHALDRATGHGCLSVVSVVCCHVVEYASGRSLFKRSPSECGVFERDREVLITRRVCPTRGCCAIKKILTKLRAPERNCQWKLGILAKTVQPSQNFHHSTCPFL